MTFSIKVHDNLSRPKALLTHQGRLWLMFFARALTPEGEMEPLQGQQYIPFNPYTENLGWPYPIKHEFRRFALTFVNVAGHETGFVQMMGVFNTGEQKTWRIPVEICNARDTDALIKLIYGTDLAAAEFKATGGAVKRMHDL